MGQDSDVAVFLAVVRSNLMLKDCPKVGKCTRCFGQCPDCRKKKIYEQIRAKWQHDPVFSSPVLLVDDGEEDEDSISSNISRQEEIDPEQRETAAQREERVRQTAAMYDRMAPLFDEEEKIDIADINKRGLYGRTCLHEACLKGELDVVKRLVETGADRTIKDNNGHTPFRLAIIYHQKEVADYLRERRETKSERKETILLFKFRLGRDSSGVYCSHFNPGDCGMGHCWYYLE